MDQKVDVVSLVRELGAAGRAASRELARASTEAKNRALGAMAAEIRAGARAILAANAGDVAQARADGNDAAFIDRLTLTPRLVEQMAQGAEQVAALPDPVGAITERAKQPSGIEVARMRVPLGVVGIIYESRPNVTADAAALCVKAGNACILRGGSESLESQIPMIKHLDGVCHVYVDDQADADMAVRIADNAKTQRYGTCNTMETLLVAEG